MNRCSCKCFNNFDGYDCSLFNTKALPTLFDTLECNNTTCSKMDNKITGKCPIKCLCIIKTFFTLFLNNIYFPCFIVCNKKTCQNKGFLTYQKGEKNCLCSCTVHFEGEFCQNPVQIFDRCDALKLNKCEQIDGRFDAEESFESAIMINAIATEGDSGTSVPAENVFINSNITFSYDEIVHYNSKLSMNKFTNILVSGKSLFSTRYDYETAPDQNFSYKIVNGNMTIYCEELIFGNGSAQLVSTSSRTTMINDTFYQ
jgi:hypothetical protein